jgi:hypothetical protein
MNILKIATLAALVLGKAAYGDIITYNATLLGANENPPTASTGTGEATLIINTILQTMEVQGKRLRKPSCSRQRFPLKMARCEARKRF